MHALCSVCYESFGCLVEIPFRDFKKALGREGVLVAHENHKVAVLRASSFKENECNSASRVDVQMLPQQENEFIFNKAALLTA